MAHREALRCEVIITHVRGERGDRRKFQSLVDARKFARASGLRTVICYRGDDVGVSEQYLDGKKVGWVTRGRR